MYVSFFLRRGLPFFAFFASPSVAQRNLDVPWSDKKYGSDGPWQAVRITVGGSDPTLKISGQNHADIDVYPGGPFETFTFSNLACDAVLDSFCGEGGTWEPDQNATMFIPATGWHPPKVDQSYGLLAGPANYTSRALTILDKTVWNTSILHTNRGNITMFTGKTTCMRLGYLGLGAAHVVQTFSNGDGADDDLVSNIFNGKLYEAGIVASYSYLLHIGSAAFNYPGSLVFGGYNKGRVIGPMASFRDENEIDLLDIGIGVEHGESPFDVDGMQNLLVSDTGTTGLAQRVRIDPQTPYLALPDNTCEGFTRVLPIQYNQSTRYYHWKTDDPSYNKIVSSPAYLNFVFPPGPGTSANVTIKVPFALLNLTLDTPILDTPTQYFPCHSYTSVDEEDQYRLGRAFLQAAFVGRNWASQMTWLGQAPGPGFNGQGLGDQLVDITEGATTLDYWDSGEVNYFNQSWAGHWSVVDSVKPSTNNTGGSPNPSSPASTRRAAGELSTGAHIGIGIGVAVAGLAMIGIGILLWRRRNIDDEAEPSDSVPAPEKYAHDTKLAPEYIQVDKQHTSLQDSAQEIYTAPGAMELPDSNDTRSR